MLARAHSHKTHLGAHRVRLLRRSHRQHQKAYSSEAPLMAGIPLAPSGVAIDELGSVEVRGRTIRSKALSATDLLPHLPVPFRLHCALLAMKVGVGGGLTRMRLPCLCPCAATSPPSHFLRQLTK